MIRFFDNTADKSQLDKLTTVLIFLSMVLIGSDRMSIKVSGMTFRFVQLLLLITFIVLYLNKKFSLVDAAIFAPFLIANIVSTAFSYSIKSSIMYIIWTVFNYLLVYCLFYTWAKNKNREYTVDFWMLSFAVQAIYVVIQYIMGLFKINDIFFPMQVHLDIYRPAIWFYEPSYLATYFSVFLTMSVYLYINLGKGFYRNCMWAAYFCILVISSTTGYLAMAISVGGGILLSLLSLDKAKLRRIGIVVVTLAALSTSTYVVDPHMFNVFAGRIFNAAPAPVPTPSIDSETKVGEELINKISESSIGASSGGRVQGWIETINVFIKHPVVGIGPNAYPIYTKNNTPPSNVTLEILANIGIVGFITFVIFVLNILRKGIKGLGKNDYYGKAIIIAFIVFVIVLQANQNYLRLYLWMQLGLLAGCLYKSKRTVY